MFGNRRTLRRLDRMLEDGINGTFEESAYNETQLSKIESKWLRYLTLSKFSYQKTEREKQKLKELVSDISHQTKTPIANIVLYSQLLQEQNLDGESQQMVDEICQQTEKLDFLIQSLVKISRLETGTFQFSAAEHSIDDLVDAVMSQAISKARQKQIHICYDRCFATARFDMKWTQEALFNILDNAVKYSPENSEIRLEVKTFEMFACVSVADQGIGISQEELPLIFGRFYRGKQVSEKQGVGIGLYLSRQIVEEQGGYIQVESKMGEGSVFKIFLRR